MARALTLAVFCLCLAITYAADLRRLIAERANADPYAPAPTGKAGGVEGKGSGDLDTAHSFGWGGPGFYGGGWGGPWGYGYGGYGGYGGWGGPWGYGGYGGWW